MSKEPQSLNAELVAGVFDAPGRRLQPVGDGPAGVGAVAH